MNFLTKSKFNLDKKMKLKLFNDLQFLAPSKKINIKQFMPTVLNTDSEFDNIKSSFKTGSTFEEQLSTFFNKVAINDSEINSRYESTRKRLEKIFQQKVYATCNLYKYGSTVTGLGFKNCDMDIYLDLGKDLFFYKNII